MSRLEPLHHVRSGIQIITAPISRIATHAPRLARANQAGRRGARCASRMAAPAKPASRRIVKKARPTMFCWSPTSTQITHTSGRGDQSADRDPDRDPQQ